MTVGNYENVPKTVKHRRPEMNTSSSVNKINENTSSQKQASSTSSRRAPSVVLPEWNDDAEYQPEAPKAISKKSPPKNYDYSGEKISIRGK